MVVLHLKAPTVHSQTIRNLIFAIVTAISYCKEKKKESDNFPAWPVGCLHQRILSAYTHRTPS